MIDEYEGSASSRGGQDNMNNLASTRFLITGADGMLGRAFQEAIRDSLPRASVTAFSHAQLDVRDASKVKAMAMHRPEIIIHCAGMTDAEECELHPARAWESHVTGTRHVVDLATHTGARLLYPQSIFIFDGTENPVTESTPPNPGLHYARAKLEAESVVREALGDALVVRMAGFFGGEEKDKNFVGQFSRTLEGMLVKGQTSIEVGDRVWQPTYTLDLARNCLLVLDHGGFGVYHMGSIGEATFFDVATCCVDSLGLSSRIHVAPAPAAKFASGESARRPLRLITSNSRLAAEGIDRQRPWRTAMREYLQRPHFARLRRDVSE